MKNMLLSTKEGNFKVSVEVQNKIIIIESDQPIHHLSNLSKLLLIGKDIWTIQGKHYNDHIDDYKIYYNIDHTELIQLNP